MTEATTPVIRRNEVALAGQHERNARNGYDPVRRLPQMVDSSATADGERIEVILDADYEMIEPTADNLDPEPIRHGVLELRFFRQDDDGEELEPVVMRMKAEHLPRLAQYLAQATSTAAVRFDFVDPAYANR